MTRRMAWGAGKLAIATDGRLILYLREPRRDGKGRNVDWQRREDGERRKSKAEKGKGLAVTRRAERERGEHAAHRLLRVSNKSRPFYAGRRRRRRRQRRRETGRANSSRVTDRPTVGVAPESTSRTKLISCGSLCARPGITDYYYYYFIWSFFSRIPMEFFTTFWQTRAFGSRTVDGRRRSTARVTRPISSDRVPLKSANDSNAIPSFRHQQ